MAARKAVLEVAAALFPAAQARAFRERVDVARALLVEAVERWLASKSAVAVVEPRPSCPAPKAGGGLEEPQPGFETASPVPDGEAAPSTAERWSAPAASVAVAQPQPGFETTSPVPKASEVDQPRPSGGSASSTAKRGSAPAASAGAELRPDAEASPLATSCS